MIFYLLTGTIGWTYYLTKESVLFFYNIYKNRKREKRLLLLEDKLAKQRKLIYDLQFDLENKENPNSTHGFELIKNDE
jgi:hypothetical protein